MEKAVLLMSTGTPSVESLTLIRHWDEIVPGTVQDKSPCSPSWRKSSTRSFRY